MGWVGGSDRLPCRPSLKWTGLGCDKKQDEKAKAVSRLQEVITDAQYALDLVFSAGTLATLAGVARSDSAQYASKLQDGRYN